MVYFSSRQMMKNSSVVAPVTFLDTTISALLKSSSTLLAFLATLQASKAKFGLFIQLATNFNLTLTGYCDKDFSRADSTVASAPFSRCSFASSVFRFRSTVVVAIIFVQSSAKSHISRDSIPTTFFYQPDVLTEPLTPFIFVYSVAFSAARTSNVCCSSSSISSAFQIQQPDFQIETGQNDEKTAFTLCASSKSSSNCVTVLLWLVLRS